MQEFKRNILWLKEIQSDDSKLVGEKAGEMAKIHKHVSPVIPSFVLTAHALNSFLNQKNLKQNIVKLIEETDVNNEAALEECALSIHQAIQTLQFPPLLKEDLRKAYHKIGERELAWLSDSNEETVALIPSPIQKPKNYSFNRHLARNSGELARAIQKTWSDYFSMENIRRMKEENKFNFDFALVVQKQGKFDVQGTRTTGKEGHKESLQMKKDLPSFDQKMKELARASELLKAMMQGDCVIEWGIEKNNLLLVDVRKHVPAPNQPEQSKQEESKLPLGIEDLSAEEKGAHIEIPEITEMDPIQREKKTIQPVEENPLAIEEIPSSPIEEKTEIKVEEPVSGLPEPAEPMDESEEIQQSKAEKLEEKTEKSEKSATEIQQQAIPEEKAPEIIVEQKPELKIEEKIKVQEKPEMTEDKYPELERAESSKRHTKWFLRTEKKEKKKDYSKKESAAIQTFIAMQEEVEAAESEQTEEREEKVEGIADAIIPTKIENESAPTSEPEHSDSPAEESSPLDQSVASGLDAFELLENTNFWHEKMPEKEQAEVQSEAQQEIQEEAKPEELPLFFEMPSTKFLPERVEKRWKFER